MPGPRDEVKAAVERAVNAFRVEFKVLQDQTIKTGPSKQVKVSNLFRVRLPSLLDKFEANGLIKPHVFVENMHFCARRMVKLNQWDMALLCFERLAAAKERVSAATQAEEAFQGQSISAQYEAAQVRFELLLLDGDHSLSTPAAVEGALDVLATVRGVMQGLLGADKERLCWQLFNGTVVLHRLCQRLFSRGFAAEVAPFYNWCILCLESVLPLCAVKYLPWRLRLYSCAARCYERLGRLPAAQRCAARAAQQVNLCLSLPVVCSFIFKVFPPL